MILPYSFQLEMLVKFEKNTDFLCRKRNNMILVPSRKTFSVLGKTQPFATKG